MTELSTTNGKFFWFGFGIFLVLASKITWTQLETFKARCEITPPRQRDNLDKDIEDAIKLDTLHTLAKGVNYNLARASLRIIAERALSKEPFQLLLQQAASTDPPVRLQALKTLRFLICSKPKSENYYENDADYLLTKEIYELKLCVPRVYHTLVRAMFMCLPRKNLVHDKESERYAMECLCKLLHQNSTLGIEPKLVLYLKHYPIEGYENVVQAFHDREYERDNELLHEIYVCVLRSMNGVPLLKEMGMWYDNEENGEKNTTDDALMAAAAAAAAGIHPDLLRLQSNGTDAVSREAAAEAAGGLAMGLRSALRARERRRSTNANRSGRERDEEWEGDAQGEPTLDPEAMIGPDGSVSYA